MTQNVVCFALAGNDNCATMLHETGEFQKVKIIGALSGDVLSAESIPCGYKIALADIQIGDTVIKNSCPIGKAIKHIFTGEMIHLHNICSFCAGEGNEC